MTGEDACPTTQSQQVASQVGQASGLSRPFPQPARLKHVFQTELNIARRVGLSADLAESGRGVDVRAGRAEDLSIEDVEEFRPELEPVRLVKSEILENAEILIEQGKSSDIAQNRRRVSDREGRRL